MATTQIGITGNIGAGKSIVCKVLQVLGVPVYEADSRAKWLMQHQPKLKKEILNHFGQESYLPNGMLNRSFLASIVFADEKQTALINSLVHPAVKQNYQKWIDLHYNKPIVAKEAALLLENGSYTELNHLVVVHAPKDIRIQRIQQRDPHRTWAQIEAIMSKQWPDDKKIKMADTVIYNDNKQAILPQVLALHQQLTKQRTMR